MGWAGPLLAIIHPSRFVYPGQRNRCAVRRAYFQHALSSKATMRPYKVERKASWAAGDAFLP